MDDYLSKALEDKKIKAGLYLPPDFYYKVRIWLMSRRPRISFSEYAETAIRERFEKDTTRVEAPIVAKRQAP
jgi:hypothetical protein